MKTLAIINRDKPPSVEKVKYCENCAYNDFCWS
ncbi:Dna2/Cas4 domain-containing protein [Methanophagales archaeon]|nr:MAG: Dna2/Cas4 domain-containing protein [Methanophagales archaeon]